MFGVARLRPGARRQQLAEAIAALLDEDFAGRVLSFDIHAAAVYAELMAGRERAGRLIAMVNAQIAAICQHHGATLATRNQKGFEGMGPWS